MFSLHRLDRRPSQQAPKLFEKDPSLRLRLSFQN